MFNRFGLLVIALAAALTLILLIFPEGGVGIGLVLILTPIVLIICRHFSDDKGFVTKVFILALIPRLAFGIFIHVFDLRSFFGGDSITYDLLGNHLMSIWSGTAVANDFTTQHALSMSGSGWGMNYFVASIYFIVGHNILAAQSICGLIGASTAPMVYLCARKIFDNINVARFSALSIALFPSFIIWSSQLIKDGLVIFLLVLAMTMIIQLQDRFNYASVMVLLLALFSIMSLRFYIFYMVLAAVAGSFLIGMTNTIQAMSRRAIALAILGLGLTYFGVIRTASIDLGQFGSLEAVQRSRLDLATSASSGYGAELDVSTSSGAIAALPMGFTYLMLAPFPWQMENLRQSITLPEVLLWWSMIPLMISGLWYCLRHKLRKAIPILMFTLMLTLAYSIFEGNVGTAYRQRTQIQVFLFMFIGVGWVLLKEKRDDTKLARRKRQETWEASLKGRMS